MADAAPTFDPNQAYETQAFDPVAYTREMAGKYGLDPELAVRVGEAESGWRLDARSPKGAYGPFQLMAPTARELGVDRYDPYQNIEGGVRYLAQLQKEFGDPALTAAAYNAGPGTVRQHGGVPDFPETRAYVDKVTKGLGQPPAFDPNAPFDVASGEAAPAADQPPPFDPNKPYDVTTDAKPHPAHEHPVMQALAKGLSRVAEAATAAAERNNPVDIYREAAGHAAEGALGEINNTQGLDANGNVSDPLGYGIGLLRKAMGVGGLIASPVVGAGAVLGGRGLQAATQGLPENIHLFDIPSGRPRVKGTPGEDFAFGNVPVDVAPRIHEDEPGNMAANVLPMLHMPPTAKGTGAVIDAVTGDALTAGQEAAHKARFARGEIDTSAPAGSQANPRAQREAGIVPPAGEWFYDLEGNLRQSEGPQSAAAPAQPGPAAAPEPAPTVVDEVVVEGHRAPEPEPPPFDPTQPHEVVAESPAPSGASDSGPVVAAEAPPAFDPAQPFEAADDFPGDRIVPEQQASTEVDAPKTPESQSDLTDRALDLIRAGKEVRQNRGPSLVDALAKEGGIRDEAGELSAMDPRAYGQRGGRLVRKNGGMSLDEAAQWAQERGYIGKPDLADRASLQELLEAVRRDLDGEKVYARENPEAAELSQHADDLEEMLHELGLDPQTATNAEIKQKLNDYFSAPEAERDAIFGVRRRAPEPDQLELPGVEPRNETAELIAQTRKRMELQAERAASREIDNGPLFDETTRAQKGLFGAKATEPPREPIVRLTGDEIAPRDTPVAELRTRARAFYDQHLKPITVESEALGGREVGFNSEGRKKSISFSADPDKLRVFAALPDLIERGVYAGSEAPHNPAAERTVRAYHRINGDVEMDGKPVRVQVIVRETGNGDFHYDHWVRQEGPAAPDAHSTPADKSGGGTSDTSTGAATKQLAETSEGEASPENMGDPRSARNVRLQGKLGLKVSEPLAADGSGSPKGLRAAPEYGPVKRAESAKPQAPPKGAERVEHMLTRLRDAFSTVHRQGRMSLKGEDVRGQYDPMTGVARTKDWSAADETTHELFHDLDFQNLPNLRKAIDGHAAELQPLDYMGADPKTGAYRPEAKREGFAEFGRWYVTNPTEAKARAPKFYDAFEAALGKDKPKLLKTLRAVQLDYAGYLKTPSADRLAGAVVSTADKGPMGELFARVKKDGPASVFKDWLHERYFRWQDSQHGLTRWEQGIQRLYHQNFGKALDLEGKESPQQLARLMSNAAGDGMADLTEGVRMPGEIEPKGPKLPAILEKAYKGDWSEANRRQFSAYLIARRLENEWVRFARGELPKPPFRETAQSVRQALKDFEAAHPEWRALADEVSEHQRLVLEKSYRAGLIDKKAYEAAQKDHPFYVPLNRDRADKGRLGGPGRGASDGADAGGLKRFVGSTRDFVDPIESIMRRSLVQSAVIKANDVKVAMAAAARKAGRGSGFFAEEVPNAEIKAYNIAAEDALKATAEELGVSLEDVREALQAADMELDAGAKLTLFRAEKTKPRGEPIVFYWEGGQRHALRLGDDSIGRQTFQALTDVGKPASNLILDILAPPARLLQTGVTTHPAYFLANTARDAVASVANTPWGVNFKPVLTTLRGIADDVAHTKNAKLYDRFGRVRGGAAMAAQAEAQFRREVTALRKRNIVIERFAPFNHKGLNLGGVAHLAELSEAGTRMGIFRLAMKKALKDGLSPESAAIRASNETADILAFDRHGARMFTAHKAVTFLNAWQQGLDKMVRSATAPTAVKKLIRGEALTKADKRALATAGGKWWPVFASTAIVGLLQSIAYHDDPEYQEISPYLRATHWFVRPEDVGLTAAFPSWEGKWVAIPKPFELAAPSNVVERMFEATADHDQKAVDRMWSGLKELLFPPTGIPLLATHEQVIRNRDYNGKPIIPEHLTGPGDPELKVNAYTSDFSKWLSHQVGNVTEKMTGERHTFSPAVADHWIQSLGASWGRSFLSESNRVVASLKGKPQPALGPDEGLVSARFIRDVTRSSQSQADFWSKVGKDEGEYEGAFQDVSKVYKDDPEDALRRLSKMPEDQRDYALARMFGSMAVKGVPGGASMLHPMVRAREMVSAISDVRKQVRSGDVVGPQGKIDLTADERRRADDVLSHIAMAEMRDALIESGAKGYDSKAEMDVGADRAKLEAINPGLVTLLDGEAASRNVPSAEVSRVYWPIIRDRLRMASDAMLEAAMQMKRTRTKSGKYDELIRQNRALLGED